MSNRSLPKEEIAKRLIRLRNLEVLHEAQRFKIWHLRDENRVLRKEVKELKHIVQAQQATIDDLKLQIEELRTIVFGKKRTKSESHDDDFSLPPVISSGLRSTESYQRKLPEEHEITEINDHPIDRCVHCGGAFNERDSTIYYEEDIPLPPKKAVIRHIVEKGYCQACRRWSAGIPIPSAPVILGENIRRYVVYLNVICRQSYAHIEDILNQSYGFPISQGEIAKIIEREGERLRPEYERLKANIRSEPSIHLDETGWNILIGGDRSFAWTMTGGVSSDGTDCRTLRGHQAD